MGIFLDVRIDVNGSTTVNQGNPSCIADIVLKSGLGVTIHLVPGSVPSDVLWKAITDPPHTSLLVPVSDTEKYVETRDQGQAVRKPFHFVGMSFG